MPHCQVWVRQLRGRVVLPALIPSISIHTTGAWSSIALRPYARSPNPGLEIREMPHSKKVEPMVGWA
jgi:hypothetical protein